MPIAAIIFSLVATGVLWAAVGNSLGLWLGGFGVVAILLPAFSIRRMDWIGRTFAAGAITDVVAVAWLVATWMTAVTLLDWVLCAAVLYAFALCGFGTMALLRAFRVPATWAVCFVTIGLLAWLAAPVWLSPWMTESIATALGRFHPLLATNSRVAVLGIWLEQGVVYHHTTLGQDVAYALPVQLWPSVALHAMLGAIGVFSALVCQRRPTAQSASVPGETSH